MKTASRNTLALFTAKQPVPRELRESLSLELLLALDAAKRGKATDRMCNVLSMYLMAACMIWAKYKKRTKYDECSLAWNALLKAALRPTEALDLTTKEYAQLRAAVVSFVDGLRVMEVGVLTYAIKDAHAQLCMPVD